MKKKKKTVVVVECAGCGKRREIGPGEVAADDFPMCDVCYLPMCPVKAESK